MAAEEWSIQRELAALREGLAALEKSQLQLAAELVRTRTELREDIRDLRVQMGTLQNGLSILAGATVAGLLGVIATLIATAGSS